jgi:hypothetical protein
MEELLYSDTEDKYFLLDYSPSHSEMVIRKIGKGAKHHVHLFFKTVCNIRLAVNLNVIKVFKVPLKDRFFGYPNHADRIELYKITDSSGYVGYIDASVFVVFHNSLGVLQTGSPSLERK